MRLLYYFLYLKIVVFKVYVIRVSWFLMIEMCIYFIQIKIFGEKAIIEDCRLFF